MEDNDDELCGSCKFPEWWVDNCCETCSELVEDQCRMQIRGLGWVEVFFPVGTDPVLSLNDDMQGRVIKVIFGDGKG